VNLSAGHAALSSRDFRLYLAGQALSQLGTKMQGAALLWHLYTLTKSPYAMGAFGLARLAPLLLLGLFGGVVADRIDRRRLLIGTELTLGVLALVLALWTYAGLRHAWPIYLVSVLSGVVGSFDGPARQALLPGLVPAEHLNSAIALDALAQKLAKVVGPLLMGVMIASGGAGAVYVANAVSYLFVVGALIAIHNRGVTEDGKRRGAFSSEIVEALRHVIHSSVLGPLLALDFAATLFGAADTMLPIFSVEILHLGPRGYGGLAAAAPVGAVLGSFVAAFIGSTRNDPWRHVVVSTSVYGAAVVGLGLSRSLPVAMVMLAFASGADAVGTVVRNTLRHATTPNALRGRVASLNSLLSKSGPRLGEMEAGIVAGLLGVSASIASGGAACLVCVAVLAPLMRRRTQAVPEAPTKRVAAGGSGGSTQ
jgi:MFS family permease